MTPDRFETLAEAFGADIARWPAREREAAATLMIAEARWAAGVLSRADDLDAILGVHIAPRASAALTDRIVASAPAKRRPHILTWLAPAGLGAGLAAACAAGFIVGVQFTPDEDRSSEMSQSLAVAMDDDYGLDLDGEIS